MASRYPSKPSAIVKKAQEVHGVTDEQMDRKIDKEHFQELAHHVKCTANFESAFGLTKDEKKQLTSASGRSSIKMIELWSHRVEKMATYRKFLEITYDCTKDATIVEKIFKIAGSGCSRDKRLPERPPRKKKNAKLASELTAKPSAALQLIRFDEKTETLKANPEALALISSIEQPVAVLSICGPSRTGKSFFMSQFAGLDIFKVSSTTEPCTKGIWMSPRIIQLGQVAVILLDTEGMDAPQSDQNLHGEVEIFVVLTMLLSSYLIYNTKGEVSKQSLETLRYFGECSKRLLDAQNNEKMQIEDLKLHFPDFFWLMRDNDLTPVNERKEEISITEYMHQKILKVTEQPATKRDQAVTLLKEAFPSLAFKTIPHPGDLGTMNSVKFLSAIEDTFKYISREIKPKYGLNKDYPLTGRTLAKFLEQYIEALNKEGGSIVLENSHYNAIEVEVNHLIDSLVQKYLGSMRSVIDMDRPLEEGDTSKLKSSHSDINQTLALPEEDAHQSWLQFQKKVENTVAPTLCDKHLAEYILILSRDLCAKIDKLVPKAGSCSKFKDFKKRLIENFQKRLIIFSNSDSNDSTSSSSQLEACPLKNLLLANSKKSKDVCAKLFIAIYTRQKEKNLVNLSSLEKDYLANAAGPAKANILQHYMLTVPRRPTNVNVADISAHSITITWQPSNISHFEVYCVENGSAHVLWQQIHPPHNNVYVVKDLKPNKDYDIQIRGLDTKTQNIGEFSEPSRCRTKIDRPSQPQKPTLTVSTHKLGKLSVKQLTIDEENGDKITDITVIKKGDRSSVSQYKDTHYKAAKCVYKGYYELEIDVTCAPDDTSLYFSVLMRNSAGLSEPSEAFVLEAMSMIPGPPEGVESIAQNASRSIQLSWNPSSCNKKSVKEYRIRYRLKGSNRWQNSYTVEDCSYSLTGLSPNTQYDFEICPRNMNHEGEAWKKCIHTESEVPNKPERPSLEVLSSTIGRITVKRPTLNDSNGRPITKVVIERGSTSRRDSMPNTPNNWAIVETRKFNAPESIKYLDFDIKIDNFDCEKTLFYRLLYENAIGEGEPSDECIVGMNQIFPGKIEQINAESHSHSILLTWNPPKINPAAARSYDVCYCKAGTDSWTTIKYNGSPSAMSETAKRCALELEQLKPNTKYMVKVNAVNESGLPGEVSKTKTYKTDIGIPCQPKIISIIARKKNIGVMRINQLTEQELNGDDLTHIKVIKRGSDHTKKQEHPEIKVKEVKNVEKELEIEVNLICGPNDSALYFSVQMRNSAGLSEPSEPFIFQALNMIPGPPEKVEAEETSRSVKLIWKPPSSNRKSVKEYAIRYRPTGMPDSWVNHSVVPSCSISFTELSPYTLYEFEIHARSNSYEGETYKGNFRTKSEAPNRPEKPTLTICSATNGKLTFKRPKDTDCNGKKIAFVKIERTSVRSDISTIPSGWVSHEEKVFVSGSSSHLQYEINLENVDHEKTITYYRILYKNGEGYSDPSEECAVDANQMIPGKVAEFKTEPQSHSILLTWNPPPINPAVAKQYEIHYREIGGTWGKINYEGPANAQRSTSMQICITDLLPNQKYEIYLIAKNNLLHVSEKSGVQTVKTLSCAPPKPDKPELSTNGAIFKLKVTFPSIKKCGEKITKAHFKYYSLQNSKFLCQHAFDVEQEESEVFDMTRHITVDTAWVGVSLENDTSIGPESELVGVSTESIPPGPPINLKAVKPLFQGAILSWNPAKENGDAAKKYEIIYSAFGEENWIQVNNPSIDEKNNSAVTVYESTIRGLKPNKAYNFKVRGMNILSVGEYSECGPITTRGRQPDKPLPPTLLKMDPKNPCKIALELSSLTEEQLNGFPLLSVDIQLSREGNSWEKVNSMELKELAKQTYVVDLPSFETKEDYSHCKLRVLMCNEVGESEPSDPLNVPLKDFFPGQPCCLTIDDGCSPSFLKVSWQEPTMNKALLHGYIVEYAKVNDINQIQHSLRVTETQCEITDFTPNTEYTIRVKAYYFENESPFIEERTEVYPSKPLNLRTDRHSDTQIKIRWNKPKENSMNVLFYKVVTRTLKEGSFVHERKTTGLSTVISNLISWTSYSFSVTAYNQNKKENPCGSKASHSQDTRMSGHARRAAQFFSAVPTFGVAPAVMQYEWKNQGEIVETDDEYMES